MRLILSLLAMIISMAACLEGTPNNSQTGGSTVPKVKCSDLAVVDCSHGNAVGAADCYLNPDKNVCAAKAELAAAEIAISQDLFYILTADHRLYEQNKDSTSGKLSKLSDDKFNHIVYSGQDGCKIKADNTLECTQLNLPAIPLGTKAKQVAIEPNNKVICYVDMSDEVQCLGSEAPKLKNGGGRIVVDKINSMDLGAGKFSSIKLSLSHACGRTSVNSTVCFEKDPFNKDHLYLTALPNTAMDVTPVYAATLYFDATSKGLQHTGKNFMVDQKKFLVQGQRSKEVDISNKELSAIAHGDFSIATAIYSMLCVIAEEKVYCSVMPQKNNSSLDLSRFNPNDPKKIFLGEGVICAVDGQGKPHCANFLGDIHDKRVVGF